MILGHKEIQRRIKEENLLENALEGNIEGAGVDIRAGKFYKSIGETKLSETDRILPRIEEITEGGVVMNSGDYLLVETIEKVNMPTDLAARVLPRSTLHRSGILFLRALVDPGYKGTLTFALKNLSSFPFEIAKGARVCQIIFEEVKGDSKGYNGRYQGGRVV